MTDTRGCRGYIKIPISILQVAALLSSLCCPDTLQLFDTTILPGNNTMIDSTRKIIIERNNDAVRVDRQQWLRTVMNYLNGKSWIMPPRNKVEQCRVRTYRMQKSSPPDILITRKINHVHDNQSIWQIQSMSRKQ